MATVVRPKGDPAARWVKMTALRQPRIVRPGDHIRIVSPSLPTLGMVPRREARARAALSSLGFVVSYGERARFISLNGAAAGSASDRAADLMDAFADPTVDAVLAADGGAATRDVLPHLDAAVIAESGKAFIGYSLRRLRADDVTG